MFDTKFRKKSKIHNCQIYLILLKTKNQLSFKLRSLEETDIIPDTILYPSNSIFHS